MRKGLQTLDFAFDGDALTHFGGLFLIQRFCNKLRLRRRLQRILKAAPRWINYRPEDLILTLLYVLIAGLQRINKTEILQYNGLFVSLIGVESFPDQTALRRFLQRLSPAARAYSTAWARYSGSRVRMKSSVAAHSMSSCQVLSP